jgi:hypothetical protein
MIRMSVFFLLIITGGFMMQLASDPEINLSSREDNPASIRPDSNASGVQIIRDYEAGRVEVWIRGEHFTTYNFSGEDRIPYLWPVHAEGGVTITRNFPMGEDKPEGRNDHRHHQSIWTAYGDVNGYDYWHREPIISVTVEVESGDSFGLIKAENVWVDDQGEPVVDEIRVYRFHDTPASARIFDQSVTFRASYGDVTFGDNKEGMIAFRIRPEIQGNMAGVLTNSNGDQTQKEVYGTPVPWMDYSGPIEGVGVWGIALFSHPSNFRLPAWHVRDYGLAGGNFFGMKSVAKSEEEGTYVLSKGEEITIHVRFLIHSGDVDEAEVAAHYADYASYIPNE